LLSRFWEVVSDVSADNVKGRLKACKAYWTDTLEAPEPIIDIVENGYRLPLISIPPVYYAPNHSSALHYQEFVSQSIVDLLSRGCVKHLLVKPHVCSPLLVVVNCASGKKRLVISLKHLNLFLWKCKFRYEDFKTALYYFENKAYLFTFDLKSGYHHVDIHEDFQWKGKYYAFTVLPFGFSTTCYVFTKLLLPLVKFIRVQGIRIVLYLEI
jgi:hypothetical protein